MSSLIFKRRKEPFLYRKYVKIILWDLFNHFLNPYFDSISMNFKKMQYVTILT